MAHNDISAGQRFMDTGDFPTCEGHGAASAPTPNTKYQILNDHRSSLSGVGSDHDNACHV